MRYHVQIELRLPGPNGQSEELFDLLAEAVYALDEVTDPDLGASLSSGRYDLTMIVDAVDLPSAVNTSLVATRTVLHAAGIATPGWEKLIADIVPRVYDGADNADMCEV